MRKGFKIGLSILVLVLLASCAPRIFQPKRVKLNISFKIPQYLAASKADASGSSRLIHPHATRITLRFTDGEDEIFFDEKRDFQTDQQVSFTVELPLNKDLGIEAKVYIEEDLVGSHSSTIGPLAGMPEPRSLRIGILPDESQIIEMDGDIFYYYHFGDDGYSDFTEDGVYIFRTPVLPAGVYYIYWSAGLNEFPEMHIYTSDGSTHNGFTELEAFRVAMTYTGFYFGLSEEQEVYILVLGHADEDNMQSIHLSPYDDNVLLTRQKVDEETESLLDSGSELDFGEMTADQTSTISFTFYNSYNFPISIESFSLLYKIDNEQGPEFKTNGFSLPDVPEAPIAPGKKYNFEVTFDPDEVTGERDADFIIQFDNDTEPFTINFLGSTCF